MKTTRRAAIAGALMAATAAALPDRDGQSLAAAGKRRGIAFGTAMSRRAARQDPAYASLVASQSTIMVPENELKWYAIRPDPTTIDYSAADDLLNWAEENGLAIRGHNLLWQVERRIPEWQKSFDFGPDPKRAARQMMVEHIERTCRRYASRIQSWDVVNEAIDPADGSLRTTSFSKAFGDSGEMVDLAFHLAKENLPASTELVYNDFMNWEPSNEKHRAGVLRLLEGFRKRNVPVHALGIQGHLGGGGTTGNTSGTGGFGAHDERAWRDFLDAVTAMNYRLLITEFDVNDRFAVAPVADRDAQIAAYAKAFLDVSLSYPQLHSVLLWGMSDNHTWLRGSGSGPRADGLAKRPCPYDDRLQPKPLRDAIAASLSAAPMRS